MKDEIETRLNCFLMVTCGIVGIAVGAVAVRAVDYVRWRESATVTIRYDESDERVRVCADGSPADGADQLQVQGLPPGFKIQRNADGEYRWVDENGYAGIWGWPSYADAVKAAWNIIEERKLEKTWRDVGVTP